MAKILYFGKLRDAAGRSGDDADLPGDVATISELIAWIGAREPELGAMLSAPTVRVAVDREIAAGPQARVSGAGEIAFMPPMSGG
jgi:molybdopterin synthase sulfur carrier subunit